MTQKSPESAQPRLTLYAKPSGMTSFASLWSIKDALGTKKAGHTGTLDSFADGLLVVLSGSLTHLVPHITGFAKTYRAVVCFGEETDTLDPCGTIVKTGRAVGGDEVRSALTAFTGPILQEPPAYSALHVGGKRASDLARNGKPVALESRAVFVYELDLLDFAGPEEDGRSYALLEVTCSKGTYVRALARDIARSLGTAAHLLALRRTAVGPFSLADAAGLDALGDFTIQSARQSAAVFAKRHDAALSERRGHDEALCREIITRTYPFTPELAARCAFDPYRILPQSEKAYLNGRPLKASMLERIAVTGGGSGSGAASSTAAAVVAGSKKAALALFYADGQFAGVATKGDGKLRYGFVSPRASRHMQVLTWQQAMQGDVMRRWGQGTALTVGSFDGLHLGHAALVEQVMRQPGLSHGVVTFARPVHGGDDSILPLSGRLSLFEQAGLDFAIVIDFSEDFSKIEGQDFIGALCDQCGMKYLAEGQDFTCGHGGSLGVEQLRLLAAEKGFELCVIPDVLLDGVRVSSSRIRKAIQDDDLAGAARMLGRPYTGNAE